MEKNGNRLLDKKKIISILVIIAILVAIFVIWIIKNNEKKELKEDVDTNTTTIEQVSVNPDFELAVTRPMNMEKLKSYGLPIIIDFGSDGCIPCRQMAPALKLVNNNTQGKAIVKYVDVWQYPKLADGYPIELIPTQIFINSKGEPFNPENADEMGLEIYKDENGKHLYTMHVGALTKDEMYNILREMGMNE